MFFNISSVHLLVVLSAAVTISGSIVYIRDTIRGKTKPNRVSWFMWAAAPLIATIAAISAGGDLWVIIRVFLAGLLPLIVFTASFLNPKSYWQLRKFDFAFGASAAIGIILWIVIDSPRLAILFLAIADGCASIPTITKAWKFPETETGFTYITSLVSVLLIIPSIPVWNIENSAFQIYLLISNILLVFAVYRKRFTISFPKRFR